MNCLEVDHETDDLSPAELDQKQLDREDAVQTFICSIDEVLWARAFMATLAQRASQAEYTLDEGMMIEWFTNALHSGITAGRAHEKRVAELVARERIEEAIGTEVHH